jgi:hypothetical protein
LDGDRDNERRRDLTAELTSTWWTCVGDGSVRVPPPLFEYDMMWNVADIACDIKMRNERLEIWI